MNRFESIDFNAGVIYNKIEKAVVPLINGRSSATSLESEIQLPFIQLVPKGSVEERNIVEVIIEATLLVVSEHFKLVYGNTFELEFGKFYDVARYYHIPYTITKKEKYKEMTVADIEAALGYKIKIVDKI